MNCAGISELASGVKGEFKGCVYPKVSAVKTTRATTIGAQSDRMGRLVKVGPSNGGSDSDSQVHMGELLNIRLDTRPNTRLTRDGYIAAGGIYAGVTTLVCIDGEATREQAVEGDIHGGYRCTGATHKVGENMSDICKGFAALPYVDVDQLSLKGACRKRQLDEGSVADGREGSYADLTRGVELVERDAD